MKTLDSSIASYVPALTLEAHLSRPTHRRLLIGFAFLTALTAAAYGTLMMRGEPFDPLRGTVYLSGSIYFSLVLLRLFHNAFYFKGFHSITARQIPEPGMTYEVARIFRYGRNNLTTTFMAQPQGRSLLRHLGFSDAEIVTLINALPPYTKEQLVLSGEQFVTFSDLARALYTGDTHFAEALREKGVNQSMFEETLGWITRTYYMYKHDQRWWGRDALKHLPSIGTEWSYGYTYHLERYARSLRQNSLFAQLIDDNEYASERMHAIEEVLARNREANVLLVAEPGVGEIDIVRKIAERIERSLAVPALKNHRFIVLDTERLLIEFSERAPLEAALNALFSEAVQAGNTIVIIEQLGRFVRAAESINADIAIILEPYLASPDLHIIATSDPGLYHLELEKLPILTRLEVIHIEPPSLLGTERLLENLARAYEIKHRLVLTYPAIHTITNAADRYVMTGVMPDKAIDLMAEVAGAAEVAHIDTVTETFVEEYLKKKTGIPMGPIDGAERDILLDLEGRLHERVVGQDHAIVAISSTLRRARAGIQSSERPLGSFLFLGPTGVGKTETAKALAAVFFGAEANLRRLDMSEYSGNDALERLLGDVTTPGLLANIVSEHPYCVLLLDEFEKADQRVHDLFLQVLDEGSFTDARGSKINLRNTIIIATSNAGSQHILAALESAQPLETAKDAIINDIIAAGTYRPELINRFDGVILFEPLTETDQAQVAKLMLDELSERLLDKGYTVSFSPEVLPLIAAAGFSRTFGARPLRRVIQEKIEEAIARKIISGTMTKGSALTITPSDISFD